MAPDPDFQPTQDVYSLYPVYCTANIPKKVLDDFINTSRPRAAKNDNGTSGWHVMRSHDVTGVDTHSVVPQDDFETPFLGKSPEEIAEHFRKHVCPPDDAVKPRFPIFTFAILDARTLEDRSCLICYYVEAKGLQTVRTDFDLALWNIVPIEVGSTPIDHASNKEMEDKNGVLSGKIYDELCQKQGVQS